jgi:hypothetical protein
LFGVVVATAADHEKGLEGLHLGRSSGILTGGEEGGPGETGEGERESEEQFGFHG